MKKALIIAGILIVVIGLGALLFVQDAQLQNLVVSGDVSLERVGQEFPEISREHIEVGASHEPYNSNPPTSGPHYAQPADWGLYNQPLADEQLVHNLEHGGIWISYKTSIDAETKSKLAQIAKANPGSVIMTPRDTNDSPIVLASWTRLEKMDVYDEARILNFMKANKNKSPEPLAY
jgi:hypothetical protein